MREQDILPLPCIRTIRRYLSLVKPQCGFDDKFFILLKKKMTFLSKEQRHGMLIYDEIMLRESIDVDSKTLTYTGIEDFGQDFETSGLKANHGLVIMYQSLYANFSQPIAVFASRGPVKGMNIIFSRKYICFLCNGVYFNIWCFFFFNVFRYSHKKMLIKLSSML